MTEKIRAEFEAWAIKAKCQHGVPYFVMKDDSGMYIDHGANIAWQAWQASRAALVVELPDYLEFEAIGAFCCAVEEALDKAGVSHK